MSEEVDCKVTSEIFSSFNVDTNSTPVLDKNNVISKFTFTLPFELTCDLKDEFQKDEDGDYVIRRKISQNLEEKTIYLEHSVSTKIDSVGLQLWRAALLLADFIIYSHSTFKDSYVLELGSGVGLTSIVAGIFAKEVISTDIDFGNILKLIECNVKLNQSIINAPVIVECLDFFNPDLSPSIMKKLKDVNIVIAADVIYDNDITEAFIKTVTKILSVPPKKTMFIGLEKRYVFTISDLDSVAPCFEHFKSCLNSALTKTPFSQWSVNEIDLDFPQYFNYERTKELIMFKIST